MVERKSTSDFEPNCSFRGNYMLVQLLRCSFDPNSHSSYICNMAHDVYSELKERIIRVIYPPGGALNEKQLAEEFGVSRTPVRETLIRLECENLVASSQGRGFYVKEASIRECREVTEIRLHLAGLVGRAIVERATPATIEEFRALLADIGDTEDSATLRRHDLQFHGLVDAATRNHALVELQKLLGNQFARIRNTLDPALDDQHFSSLKDDLTSLITGLEAKDPAQCAAVLREHLMRFVRQIFSPEW
jgi:DNA-binding GntR family transcriptional regulator